LHRGILLHALAQGIYGAQSQSICRQKENITPMAPRRFVWIPTPTIGPWGDTE
jgi:hypothetical protein